MKTSMLALLSLVLLTLAGCHGMSPADNTTPPARQALPGSWTLQQADGLPDIPDNILLVLRSDSGADGSRLGISGFSGVNHFTGSASVNWHAQRLSPNALATTRKMGPEPRMKFEQSFLQQLEGVVSFQLKDGHLVLVTLAGNHLTFARNAP